jgi:DNA-binding NarL/FixJ family response regulator
LADPWQDDEGGSVMTQIDCVLVEDQSMFVELLLPVLKRISGLNIAATAETGAEGIQHVIDFNPDLLILDLSLPDFSGINVAEALHNQNALARFIVLSGQATSFICPIHLRPMLHAVVDKNRAFDVLRDEIKSFIGDNSEVSSLPENLDVSDALTSRELEVLALVGQGCSNKTIAETLSVAVGTVEVHRRNMRSKLGISGSELIRYAVMYGHEH